MFPEKEAPAGIAAILAVPEAFETSVNVWPLVLNALVELDKVRALISRCGALKLTTFASEDFVTVILLKSVTVLPLMLCVLFPLNVTK